MDHPSCHDPDTATDVEHVMLGSQSCTGKIAKILFIIELVALSPSNKPESARRHKRVPSPCHPIIGVQGHIDELPDTQAGLKIRQNSLGSNSDYAHRRIKVSHDREFF